MEQKNYGGDRDTSEQLLSPIEAFGTRTELHIVDWLVKDSSEKPKTTWPCQNYRLLFTNLQQGPNPEENTYKTH